MKVLNAYLRREILAATGVVMLAFLALFTFFDFLAELEDIGRAGYRLKHALIYVLLAMPSRAYEVMPIAVLIGTLYALTSLARTSELIVMRTAGVSTRRLMASLMTTGMIFVGTTYVLGEFIAPPLDRIAQKWRLRGMNAAVPQELRTGLWVRDGKLFVNVQRAQPEGGLEDVRIYEFDDQHSLLAISLAAKGEYTGKGWSLQNVVQTRFLPERTEVRRMPSLNWNSELTPEMLSTVMLNPDRMAIGSLARYVTHLEENKQRTGRYAISLWKKIIYPFAALVMMGLALPFAFGSQRSGNVSARVLLGIMLGMGFHLLNSLFSNLAVINGWQPLLSAAAPSAVFLLLAAGMLWVVERR